MLLHPGLHRRQNLFLANVVENLMIVALIDLSFLVSDSHILVKKSTALGRNQPIIAAVYDQTRYLHLGSMRLCPFNRLGEFNAKARRTQAMHQRIIDVRLASPAPGEPLPLDEARAEVMDSFNARRTQT